jgi:NAD(P)-dependent dehydrogenase (short-subunit alcohol dehydrogenase family)
MKIEGSVALITGSNRGLGKALVDALAAAGTRKIYAASRDGQPLPVAPGVEIVPLALDVTRSDQIAAAAERARDLTLLINNAGISRGQSILGPDAIAAAHAELETNVFGPLQMARAFAPILATNGGGAIVNVLSVLSWISMPPIGTYAASKAAAWSVTNGLRNELRAQGTQVLGVHVAFMDTDMAKTVTAPKTSPADVAAQILRGIEAGDDEVLADGITRAVKAGLSAPHASYLAVPGEAP